MGELASVDSALRDAEDEQASVVAMLRALLPHSLAVYSDERHEYQARVVDMLGGVLDGMKTKLTARTDEAVAKVAGRDNERARRRAAVTELADGVADKKCVAARTEAVVVKEQLSYGLADEDLKIKLKAQKEGDRKYTAIESKKTALDSVGNDMFAPMKSSATSEKQVKEFTKAIGWLVLDDTLLETLPSVVGKNPAVRSEFDTVVITQVEKALVEKSSVLEVELNQLQPDKDARASLVATAQAREAAAKEALTSAKHAHAAATSEVSSAENALAAAEKEWKGFGAEMKVIEATEVTAKEELSEFVEGPITAFSTLKMISAPAQAEINAAEPSSAA